MRFASRAALAALTVVVVAGAAGAQQPAAGGQFRIAFVNTGALLEAAPGRTEAVAVFERETGVMRDELNRMSDSLNALVTSYQRAEPTMNAQQREARQRTIQQFETEFQARQLQLQQQAAQRQEQLMAPIMESVRQVLDDIRMEGGWAMILANDPGESMIVSADKNLDITERVVARLRTMAARQQQQQPRPAAPAANPSGVTRPSSRPPGQ